MKLSATRYLSAKEYCTIQGIIGRGEQPPFNEITKKTQRYASVTLVLLPQEAGNE